MLAATMLEGRIAIVTGAASGMGAATARLLAEAGATVLGADIVSHPAVALVGDVADSGFCDAAVAQAVARHGRLDIVVNAAGVIVRADAPATDDDAWTRQMRVNVDGTFFMCRAAIRQMRRQGSGAIVNFGSIWGSAGGKGHVAYATAKGAVHNLTRSLALDHAREGIRINAVCPGEVDTPMLRGAGRTVPLTDAQLAEMADRVVPNGRLAQPEEIGRVVVFLCTDAASYMTGALVPVDGGWSAG
jgi:meso-butanediol dehydrogenase / (S,S)-butanediol dehydrogenase / diacetyl reductase